MQNEKTLLERRGYYADGTLKTIKQTTQHNGVLYETVRYFDESGQCVNFKRQRIA